jgi:hypothetical protein
MSAKNLKFSAARAAWPRAWVSGSPVSNVSSSAIRPARASMPSAIWLRIRARARARAARPGHGPSVNAATVAYGWLLTGSATSNVSPSTLATRPPPMKWSRVVGSPAGRRAGPVTAHHPYQQHRQHQLSRGWGPAR